MGELPGFTVDGLLPPGEYVLSIDQLRVSFLVVATASRRESSELEVAGDSQ
jgi:hypothetical protein